MFKIKKKYSITSIFSDENPFGIVGHHFCLCSHGKST